MSFDVKINFSGLLHFVENSSRNKGSFRLAIVCPEIKDHKAKIKIGDNSESIDNGRVFFKFNRTPGAQRKFNFRKGALEGNVKGAVPLGLIAGSTSLIQGIVSTDTPQEVRSQIFLEEGTFGVSENEKSAITWEIPQDMTGSSQQIKVAQEFFALIQNVESGFLVMESFDGGSSKAIPLQGDAGSTKIIDLSYSCEKDELTALAKLKEANGLFEDLDFEAHYKLLKPEGIAMTPAEKPIPRRKFSTDEIAALEDKIRLNLESAGPSLASEGLSVTGCNCLCSGGGALSFNADTTFESALSRSAELESAERLPESTTGENLDRPSIALKERGAPFGSSQEASVMDELNRYTQEQLDKAYRKALTTYAHREDVTAVDVGFRYKDNQRTDEIAVRVHVKEKLPLLGLETAEVFPNSIEGVPVDVIQAVYHPHSALASELVAELVDRTAHADPIQPGVSISHPRVTAGTFGTLVYDRRTGRPCILSNWHVLVGSASAMPGDPIVQPGRLDGGRAPRDTVAQLERMMLDQDGDAAIAILNTARGVRPEQSETDVVVRQVRAPIVGEVLEKSGRTTNVTRGKVDGLGQYKLLYSVGEVRIDGFKIVPVIDNNPNDEEVSSGGDSGSVWYSANDHQGVGLHFAGELDSDPRQEHAVACHLERVLDRLNISLTPVQQPQAAVPIGISPQAASLKAAPEIRLLVETTARLARMLEQTSGSEDSAESDSAFDVSGDTVVDFMSAKRRR